MSNFQNLTVFNKKIINNASNQNDASIQFKNQGNKIKMWTGNLPPTGYLWCDGANNTPDLRDKFIYFVKKNHEESLGNVGSDIITNIPTHNHNISSVSASHTVDNLVNFNLTSVKIDIPSNSHSYVTPHFANIMVQDTQFTLHSQGTTSTAQIWNATWTRQGNAGAYNIASKVHGHTISNNATHSSGSIDDPTKIKDKIDLKIITDEEHTTIMNNSGNIGSTATPTVFQPKYICIGFIIKDPTT